MRSFTRLIHSRAKVGTVICAPKEPTDVDFYFLIEERAEVKPGDYVEVPAGDRGIVAKVVRTTVKDELYTDPKSLKLTGDSLMQAVAMLPPALTRIRIAYARAVATISEGEIRPPDTPPDPGAPVYPLDNDTLRVVLGLKSRGVFMGTLAERPDFRVFLDPIRLLRMHFLIVGAIGTGKSYTAGVIIEEFLEMMYPVVVIDPHGEYAKMANPNSDPKETEELTKLGLSPRGYSVQVFRPKTREEGELVLDFNQLDFDSLVELTRATETMRDLLFLAVKRLREGGKSVDPDSLAKCIRELAREWGFQRRTELALRRNVEMLKELGVFGKGPEIKTLVRPGVMTVIDLSVDLPEHVKRTFIAVLLKQLFDARKRKEIPPLLVVVDECHRFASPDEVGNDAACLNALRKIAREGRKFGIGLGVISQRIVGLDKTIVSQCRTKFVLRLDMYTDIDQVAPYFDDDAVRHKLATLPDGYAYVVGAAVRFPILVKIRPKKSDHFREG